MGQSLRLAIFCFLGCVALVLFLLRSCCWSPLFSSFILFIRLGPFPASSVGIAFPEVSFQPLWCTASLATFPSYVIIVPTCLSSPFCLPGGFTECDLSLKSVILSFGVPWLPEVVAFVFERA